MTKFIANMQPFTHTTECCNCIQFHIHATLHIMNHAHTKIQKDKHTNRQTCRHTDRQMPHRRRTGEKWWK